MATTVIKVEVLDYKTCKAVDIIKWCKDNDKTDWLQLTSPDCKTFFQLRKKFFMMFMPEAMPKKTKQTYKDIIANL